MDVQTSRWRLRAERALRNSANRLEQSEAVEADDSAGEVILTEDNFEVLVTKIEGLTKVIEKLEQRFDDHTDDLFNRLRAVEQDLAVTKTKMMFIFTGLTVGISTVVSSIASLVVYWLRSP